MHAHSFGPTLAAFALLVFGAAPASAAPRAKQTPVPKATAAPQTTPAAAIPSGPLMLLNAERGIVLEKPSNGGIVSIGAKAAGGIALITARGREQVVIEAGILQDRAPAFLKTSTGRLVTLTVTKRDASRIELELKADKDGDVRGWELNSQTLGNEHFSGVCERPVDGESDEQWRKSSSTGLDLLGQRVPVLVRGTLSLYAPFFLSSRGYGLSVHGTWPGVFDFGRTQPGRISVAWEGKSFAATIYFGAPIDIVRHYTLDSGPPVALPRWAFRAWKWRDRHQDLRRYYDLTLASAPYNSQVVEDILVSEALDIPIGVYWVDRPWAIGRRGYDDFTWDERRFPNSKAMIAWLARKQITFGVWLAPAVQGKMLEEARQRNFLLPGRDESEDFGTLLDFTNAEARSWWQEKGIKPLLESGVKVFKLDRGDESFSNESELKVSNGKTVREVRNDYPRQYADAAREMLEKVHPGDGALLARAGYTGSSKSTAIWGGDITPTEWGLRSSIIGVQRASLIGFPFWGSDTGGYVPPLDREVTARWLAFSAFSPIMEVGPLEDRAFWDMPSEPAYDVELLSVYRLYSKIREKLVDYLFEGAKAAHERGEPLVRPLFVVEPEGPRSWTEFETYLLGPDLLVSPVWNKGTSSKEVYLPKGSNWIDLWNPSAGAVEGGKVVSVSTPIHQIPLFKREGSSIDLGDLPALYRDSQAKVRVKPRLAELQEEESW